jgi:phosphoglycolate phosphatase
MKLDVDLVIFDLDGTILDTAPDIERCLNLAMKDFNLPPLSRERVLAAIGPGGKAFQESLVPEPEHADIAADVVKTYRDYYIKSNTQLTRPFEGIVDVLDTLTEAGIKMTVASNKPQEQCRQILKGLGLDHYFCGIWGPEAAARPKPEPDVLHMVMELYGATADRTIMVGDTRNDVAAGRAAGVTSVFVTWGYVDVADIDPDLIDIVVDEPSGLLDFDVAELRSR